MKNCYTQIHSQANFLFDVRYYKEKTPDLDILETESRE